MTVIRRTSQFKKDVRRLKKRGKDFDGFKYVIEKIVNGSQLEPKYEVTWIPAFAGMTAQ